MEATAALTAHLDRPFPWAQFAETLNVAGWAFSSDARPVGVRFFLDGVEVAEARANIVRGDVSEAFGTPQSVECGFEVALTRGELPDRDQYVLRVEAFVDGDHSGPALHETLGEFPVEWVSTKQTSRGRGDYRQVWDGVARNMNEARVSVAGYSDDAEWERTGLESTELLVRVCRIELSDVVMEIGCGAGRIAHTLAPRCAKWIGGDVSVNMLGHAAEALKDVPNIELVALAGSDLRAIGDASLNVIYCTVVFMHLDEWDRFRYVSEMYRVLKPGGRVYFDNFNLLSDEGWTFFLEQCAHEPVNRPANISRSSTPQELRAYAERAGFDDVEVWPAGLFVAVTATKR
jgi:SAM-dependent methyltransferase